MSVRMWFLLGIIAVTACEGCVDWNTEWMGIHIASRYSHSLRGLCGLKFWRLASKANHITVTACEGCVDWNSFLWYNIEYRKGSQPARAVWIEIPIPDGRVYPSCSHSLRGLCGLKSQSPLSYPLKSCHSLRGLCGLKSTANLLRRVVRVSQPARAVWIEM